MLLALGRLRPASFEMMVLDVADSPAVSSSASPKRVVNDDDQSLRKLGGGRSIVASDCSEVKRPSSSTSASTSATSGSSTSASNGNGNGAIFVASAPIASAKIPLDFGGEAVGRVRSSSGSASQGCRHVRKHEGERDGQEAEEEEQKKLQEGRQGGEQRQNHDNSNSPSFVLGEVHGWCDSDSSPCGSSPGSLSLSNFKSHSCSSSTNFNIMNVTTNQNNNNKQTMADVVPSDRIEKDIEIQDYSPSESGRRSDDFVATGQLEGRRRMVARSQQCVVCMEVKEHTFVPAHRGAASLQCQGHRFCTDCWLEFLTHRMRQLMTKQAQGRFCPPLPCPVCRAEIYVPDYFAPQMTLPKCWQESPEAPTASEPLPEIGSNDLWITAQMDLALFTAAGVPGSLRALPSGNAGWNAPPGRMPLVQAWRGDPALRRLDELPVRTIDRATGPRHSVQPGTGLHADLQLNEPQELVVEEQVEHGDAVNCRLMWGQMMRCLRGIFPMINAGVANMDRRSSRNQNQDM